jgi:hypothetical protein
MKKLLLEINRYKQLMNIVLLTEQGKVVDAFLPIGAKSVDNLTKWETGLTRSVANTIDSKVTWKSLNKLARGKANTLL